MKLRTTHAPRWMIFLLDMGIVLFGIVLAYLLRFNFSIPEKEIASFKWVVPTVVGVRVLSFVVGRTYAGIIRYTSTKDAQRIFTVLTIGSVLIGIANPLVYEAFYTYAVPYSILAIEYLVTTFLMITLRIGVKVLYFELKSPSRERSRVLIFGAGDSGIITKRALDRDGQMGYKVAAFFDDNKDKQGKQIEGVPIYPTAKLNEYLEKPGIANVVIAVQNLGADRKREIVEQCLAHGVEVLNVPPVTNWINGELSFKQIRHARIEDLLGRDPIKLDSAKIKKAINGKTVLVTGAAGSIGSELVRQIAKYRPRLLVMLDQAESPLYELDLEFRSRIGPDLCEVVIADIRHRERMENVFRSYKPELVFHAAAYKHVPLMENNPSEAVRTNVLGTSIAVDLAMKYKVESFVMVSTDKAVNPTNIMGASKRIAEIYAQSRAAKSETRFITTRFGNVLGSNGSVIPLFRKQIEKGGPLTVTHPDVTRFFMTIPEAAQLVLEASTMGQGGEIFVFDMGKSVKIIDLAKKMIRLSGLELGKDIEIRITGLRPGEKLYEELLADKENTLPTHHPRILKAAVRNHDADKVEKAVHELIALYQQQENEAIVRLMKNIVPEFISQNSEFSSLDSETESPESTN